MRKTYSVHAPKVLLALILVFPCLSLAYNKSWDQGHRYCVPNPGETKWGHYAYSTTGPEDMEGATYSSKLCCQVFCEMCPIYANTGRLQKTFTDLSIP